MRDDGPNDDYCLESESARKPDLSCVEWSWCGTFVLAHALALVLGVGLGIDSDSRSGGCCR